MNTNYSIRNYQIIGSQKSAQGTGWMGGITSETAREGDERLTKDQVKANAEIAKKYLEDIKKLGKAKLGVEDNQVEAAVQELFQCIFDSPNKETQWYSAFIKHLQAGKNIKPEMLEKLIVLQEALEKRENRGPKSGAIFTNAQVLTTEYKRPELEKGWVYNSFNLKATLGELQKIFPSLNEFKSEKNLAEIYENEIDQLENEIKHLIAIDKVNTKIDNQISKSILEKRGKTEENNNSEKLKAVVEKSRLTQTANQVSQRFFRKTVKGNLNQNTVYKTRILEVSKRINENTMSKPLSLDALKAIDAKVEEIFNKIEGLDPIKLESVKSAINRILLNLMNEVNQDSKSEIRQFLMLLDASIFLSDFSSFLLSDGKKAVASQINEINDKIVEFLNSIISETKDKNLETLFNGVLEDNDRATFPFEHIIPEMRKQGLFRNMVELSPISLGYESEVEFIYEVKKLLQENEILLSKESDITVRNNLISFLDDIDDDFFSGLPEKEEMQSLKDFVIQLVEILPKMEIESAKRFKTIPNDMNLLWYAAFFTFNSINRPIKTGVQGLDAEKKWINAHIDKLGKQAELSEEIRAFYGKEVSEEDQQEIIEKLVDEKEDVLAAKTLKLEEEEEKPKVKVGNLELSKFDPKKFGLE